jgi:hypothetical protein
MIWIKVRGIAVPPGDGRGDAGTGYKLAGAAAPALAYKPGERLAPRGPRAPERGSGAHAMADSLAADDADMAAVAGRLC